MEVFESLLGHRYNSSRNGAVPRVEVNAVASWIDSYVFAVYRFTFLAKNKVWFASSWQDCHDIAYQHIEEGRV